MRHRAAAHPIVARAVGAALLGGVAASPAGAQMVGLPVVQTPFPGRGVVVAANGGVGRDFETVGGALLFAPNQRLSFTVGLGATLDTPETFITAGGRVAWHLRTGSSGRFGVAPFVGIGGLRADSVEIPGLETPEGEPQRTSYSFVNVPIGVSAGFRVPIGVTRAVAVHVAPSWQLWRFIVSGAGEVSDSFLRLGIGADVSITERIGFSAAFETGHRAESGELGPRDNYWGAGLSYVFR